MRRFAALVSVLLVLAPAARPAAPDDLAIWKEFSALVRKGDFPRDRIKPLFPGLENDLARFLAAFVKVEPERWERVPEVVRNGSLISFIIPFYDEAHPFNFILGDEGGRWAFRHLEQVMIRLDKTPPPPTSAFPDTDEERKAWARDEIYWSEVVGLYKALVPRIGKTDFLNLYRNGPGFFVGAKSWVPFVPPHRAFILYLCWYQANLHGMNTRPGGVTLESLDDRAAVVRIRNDSFFRLYLDSAHMHQWISFPDYREIYETIWTDRANAAGWDLKFEYPGAGDGSEVVFRFTRK